MLDTSNPINYNVAKLSKIISRASNSNSFIFSGPRGIGKSYTAKALVKNILCTEQDYSLNLLWINTIQEKVGIEDMRGIYDFITKTSYNNLPKIIVIDCIDDLNVNSMNALLKLLEEPMDNSYFILISHNISAILKTVRSRCVNIKFAPPDSSAASNIIRNNFPDIPEEQCKQYLHLANNLPGVAIDLINNNAIKFYEEIVQCIEMFDKNASILYDFIDNAFGSRGIKEDNWRIFKVLIRYYLKRLMLSSAEFEKNTTLSRDINQLFFDADTANLSIANVVLLTFYKIIIK